MDVRFRFLRFLICCGIAAASLPAFAEPAAPAPAASPSPSASPAPRGQRHWEHNPEFEKVRERLKNMTPEERKQWGDGFRMWMELPLERKEEIIRRMDFLQKKMQKDVDAALAETGLVLDEETKKEFAQRFRDGRRQIEGEIRAKYDEERKPKVKELLEKLKSEFAARSVQEPPKVEAPQ